MCVIWFAAGMFLAMLIGYFVVVRSLLEELGHAHDDADRYLDAWLNATK